MSYDNKKKGFKISGESIANSIVDLPNVLYRKLFTENPSLILISFTIVLVNSGASTLSAKLVDWIGKGLESETYYVVLTLSIIGSLFLSGLPRQIYLAKKDAKLTWLEWCIILTFLLGGLGFYFAIVVLSFQHPELDKKAADYATKVAEGAGQQKLTMIIVAISIVIDWVVGLLALAAIKKAEGKNKTDESKIQEETFDKLFKLTSTLEDANINSKMNSKDIGSLKTLVITITNMGIASKAMNTLLGNLGGFAKTYQDKVAEIAKLEAKDSLDDKEKQSLASNEKQRDQAKANLQKHLPTFEKMAGL